MTAILWRLVPGQALLQHAWGEQHAVYNNLTGDTHLLPADAMQILFTLRTAPLSQDALIASLASNAGCDAPPGPGPAPAAPESARESAPEAAPESAPDSAPEPEAAPQPEPGLAQAVIALLDELAALDLVERTGC